MTPYGKTAQAAISAMSLLAEVYNPKARVKLSSGQIAEARNLPQPLIGKVLTWLSQEGLITGSPGPGGGYILAKDPSEISLYDIAAPFDRLDETIACPFGPNWCGNQPHCPLHFQLAELRNNVANFLRMSTLEEFRKVPTKYKKASK